MFIISNGAACGPRAASKTCMKYMDDPHISFRWNFLCSPHEEGGIRDHVGPVAGVLRRPYGRPTLHSGTLWRSLLVGRNLGSSW